ncbi:MAG TPA: hypothetical protein IAC60_01440 [Candidatus Enterosoma merdigallinarum]|nr:hypothetical protein [Candidatus Enterosoma merdigallinarum]
MIFSARNKLFSSNNSMTEVSTTLRRKIFALFSRTFIENRRTRGYGVEILKYESTYIERALGELGNKYYLPINDPTSTRDNAVALQSLTDSCPWYTVFDFVELILGWTSSKSVREELNSIFENEMSPYRIIEDKVIPISNEFELQQIASAIQSSSGKFCSVQESLKQAIEQFAKRPTPDYNGSITSAITAVESVAKIIQDNDKATLGSSMDAIKRKLGLSDEFSEAIKALYHWTCNEHGKRLEYVLSDFPEAKFMLVICSSVINYLIEKFSLSTSSVNS